MARLKRIIIFTIIILICLCNTIVMANTPTTRLEPEDNQYFELRAVDVNDIENTKQVIMELWGNNIDFKGLDVRFTYDNNSFQPSNMITNEVTEDETEFFKFETEFRDTLEVFTFSDENVMEMIISFDPPVESSEHVVEKENTGKAVTTTGGVLLGKMSFKMLSESFDIESFELVPDVNTSPNTGVKTNIDGLNYYDSQSTFRFVDNTASKNADLSNMVISTGIRNEENLENSTYKEYALTPTFEKNTLNYEHELLEYVNQIDLTVTQDDETSTMKVKVPKRDDDGNLVYEDDETTIVYEEKDISNNTPLNIEINRLGEPDTLITVLVTAEDTKTKKEYTINIRRPYGIIKGTIKYDEIEENDNEDIDKTTDLNIYKTGDFNWDELLDLFGEKYEDPATYDDLDEIPKMLAEQSKSDGSYEIYVIPGEIDLQIDRRGFLDYIFTEITVNNGETIDLGEIQLDAGDVDRDRSNWRTRRTRFSSTKRCGSRRLRI